MDGSRAVVLGGGGVTGVAWEIGLLAGLAAAGVEVDDADLVIGTSAGSVVGALICSGVPLDELYQRQLAPPTGEIAARLSLPMLVHYAAGAIGDERRARARLARRAVRARTVPEEQRRAVIAGRLPSHEWPRHPRLLITAVEVDTGEAVTWDRDSGVPLVDAVAASCAVPLVWPPVTIDGKRYMDGGVGSSVNMAVARDCDTVVVLLPSGENTPSPFGDGARAEIDAFDGRTLTVFADDGALEAFGPNPLDPACRIPSARAGRVQGRREAARVAAFLGVP